MGNKVDYGELPQFIFHPNILKTAQQMVLKTTEDLRVCPGINDPTMINTAERKEHVSLYQVDSQRSIVDGKIRSTRCSHILANESKVRCHECQVFLRSNMRLQKQPPRESTQSKLAHDSHVNLSRLSRAELITRAKNLHKMVTQTQSTTHTVHDLYTLDALTTGL